MKSELETFDGRDNRKEIMILLQRLGDDAARARFVSELTLKSRNGFSGCQTRTVGTFDPVTAYFMLIGVCNELGVSINYAAQKLEEEIRRGNRR